MRGSSLKIGDNRTATPTGSETRLPHSPLLQYVPATQNEAFAMRRFTDLFAAMQYAFG
jgi:hypothetical protein